MILLEIKCPQLSKPEATATRNENSIGDRMEKKTLGETRLSRGASSQGSKLTFLLGSTGAPNFKKFGSTSKNLGAPTKN